jgi:acid phosphatase
MQRFFLSASFILLLAVFASCGHPPRQGFPQPDHIVIVIEENHGFNGIIGNPRAPYINKLAGEGALFTDAHGVTHPSQPNYIALFSGSTQGVKGDECLMDVTPYTTPNLGAALIGEGFTFTGYAETMPSSGFMKCSYKKSDKTGGVLYARKHAPWVNWIGDKENDMPASVSQPLSEFPSDFSKLPTLSFVIPNQDNDMHNKGGDTSMIPVADQWLQQHLSDYVEWAKTHNSMLIFTFDEDNFTKDNRIPTIFVGPMVKPGEYGDSINHYNVLRTIEAMYDLPASGPAKASPIKGAWNL